MLHLYLRAKFNRLLLIAGMGSLLACNELGYQGSVNTEFAEVDVVSLNEQGQFVVSWPPIQVDGDLKVEYSVFVAAATELQLTAEVLDPITTSLTSKLESSQAEYISERVEESSVASALLGFGPITTSSGTQATLELQPTAGGNYFFAVRPKIGGEYREQDQLSKVIAFVKKSGSFEGITHLSGDNSTNTLNLHWQAPAGATTSEVLYKVYNIPAASLDLESQLASGTVQLIEQTPGSQDNLGIEITRYSAREALLEEITSAQPEFVYSQEQYSINKSLMIDQDEIYYVTTTNTSLATNIFVKLSFLASNLDSFSGISSAQALSQESVLVSWERASNPEISEYRIYSDSDFKTLKKTVTATQSSTTVSGFTYGSTATLGVRAVDDYGRTDGNIKVLSVKLNNPNETPTSGAFSSSPALSATPASHDYGNIIVGNAAQNQVFTIINSGGKTLLGLFDLSNTTAFEKTSDSCSGAVLEQDQTCTLNILFSPTRVGQEAATVSVEYSDFASESSSSFSFGITGVGTADSDFAGVSGYTNLNSTTVDLSWTNDSDATNYIVYKESSDGTLGFLKTVIAPATAATITGLDPLTEYSIKVYAQGQNGAIATNEAKVTFTTPTLVTLDAMTGYIFRTNPASAGDILSFDADNPSHTGTTFSCIYDQVIDGSVSGSTACSSLPGAVNVTNLSSAGQLEWTVGSAAKGQTYELKFTGSVADGSDSQVVVVSVQRGYSTTNMIFGSDLHFGNLTNPRDNSSLWGNPQNIVSDSDAGSQMVLDTLFDRTTSSGYGGAGSTADPYYLAFDGTNDKATISGFNDETNLTVMGWFKPADITSDGTLFSNGTGALGAGIQLEQVYRDGRPYLEFTVGGEDVYSEYDTTVAAHNPLLHYRFDTSLAGDTITNLGDSSATLDVTNSSGTVGQTGLAQDLSDNTAISFSAGSYATAPVSSEYAGALSQRTMETWFQADEVDGQEIIMGYGADNSGSVHGMRFAIEHGQLFCKVSQSWNNVSYVTAPIVPGLPYHVLMTYDEPSGEFKCFLNGILIGTDATVGTLSSSAGHSTYLLTFASSLNYFQSQADYTTHIHSSSPLPFSGIIDEAAIYDEVISPANAKSHYLPRAGGKCGTLLSGKSNEWHHLAVGYHSNVGKIYINGVLQCQFETPQNGLTGGNSNLTVGANTDGSNLWAGSLGLLSVYNASSDLDAEVLAHYNATASDYTSNGMHPFLPSLITWFDASDIDADGATDDQPSDGSVLTEWKDLTNYASDVTTIHGQPLVQSSVTSASVPSIQFTNSSSSAENDALMVEQLAMAGAGLQTTIIYVFRLSAWDGAYSSALTWGSYISNLTRNNLFAFIRYNSNNQFMLVYNHSSAQDYTPNPSNTPSILATRRSGSTVKFTLDGNENVETVSQWDKHMYSHKVFIGCYSNTGSQGVCNSSAQYPDMDAFEIQLYNRYLSDNELSTLTTLLQSKWQ